MKHFSPRRLALAYTIRLISAPIDAQAPTEQSPVRAAEPNNTHDSPRAAMLRFHANANAALIGSP